MREISKVKYSAKASQVKVEYYDDNLNEWAVTLNEVDPHPDFVEALLSLVPHMIEICDFKDEEAWKYKVTGISMGGSDDTPGVVIIGQKEVLNKKVFNIVTPFVVFDPDVSDYEMSSVLSFEVIKLLSETDLLLNGKSRQLAMEFKEAVNFLKERGAEITLT